MAIYLIWIYGSWLDLRRLKKLNVDEVKDLGTAVNTTQAEKTIAHVYATFPEGVTIPYPGGPSRRGRLSQRSK